jgi:hypothetical protein
MRIGHIISIITCFALSFAILYAKKRLNHLGYILVALLAGALAGIMGGLLGLIPVAFLTTREARE